MATKPNSKANKASKASKATLVEELNMSARDIELAIMGYFCTQNELKLDYGKLQNICRFNSIVSARNQWGLTKKKMLKAYKNAEAAAGGSDAADGAATPDAGAGVNATAATTAAATASASTTKRKRAPAAKKDADDSEAPTKKPRGPAKEKAIVAKTEEQVEEQEEVEPVVKKSRTSRASRIKMGFTAINTGTGYNKKDAEAGDKEIAPVAKKAAKSSSAGGKKAAIGAPAKKDVRSESESEPVAPFYIPRHLQLRGGRRKLTKPAAPVGGPSAAPVAGPSAAPGGGRPIAPWDLPVKTEW